MQDIRLTLDSTNCKPREQLRGRASWQLSDAPQSVEIRLFWYTSGKGDRDTSLVDSKRFQQVGSSDEQEFEFRLPREPYSFSGKLISLVWAVEVVIEPGGGIAREEFVLAPEGREVQLSNASA